LDFINLMSYDFHGSWDSTTGMNAPLYRRQAEVGTSSETLNLDWAAQYWAAGGAPKDKIVIGMGAYGRSFTLANPANNDVGAPATGGGTPGPYTGESGFLAYFEICDFIARPGTTVIYHTEHRNPYAFNGNQWVSFDNEQSLTEKINYVRANGFGGWMTWNIDLDDFTGGHCGAAPYPLHKHLNGAKNIK